MKRISFLIFCVFLGLCCMSAGCLESASNGTSVPVTTGTAVPIQTGTPVAAGHSGTGNMSLSIPLNYGVYLVEFQNNGTGPFLVELSNTEFYQQIIWGEENVKGTQVAGIPESGMYWLNVTSEGLWDVTIGRPGANAPPAPPLELSGTGDFASGFIMLPSANVSFAMTNNGTGPFSVWLYDEIGNFVFDPTGTHVLPLPNHFGAYNSTVTVDVPVAGRYVINVVSDGLWSVEVG